MLYILNNFKSILVINLAYTLLYLKYISKYYNILQVITKVKSAAFSLLLNKLYKSYTFKLNIMPNMLVYCFFIYISRILYYIIVL